MFSHKESAVRTAAAAVDASNNLGKMYVLWIIFFWADLAAFQILTFSFALRNSWFLEQLFPTRGKTEFKVIKEKSCFQGRLLFRIFQRNYIFYLGFLSRIFTIHRTAGEERWYFFNSSLPPSQELHVQSWQQKH